MRRGGAKKSQRQPHLERLYTNDTVLRYCAVGSSCQAIIETFSERIAPSRRGGGWLSSSSSPPPCGARDAIANPKPIPPTPPPLFSVQDRLRCGTRSATAFDGVWRRCGQGWSNLGRCRNLRPKFSAGARVGKERGLEGQLLGALKRSAGLRGAARTSEARNPWRSRLEFGRSSAPRAQSSPWSRFGEAWGNNKSSRFQAAPPRLSPPPPCWPSIGSNSVKPAKVLKDGHKTHTIGNP